MVGDSLPAQTNKQTTDHLRGLGGAEQHLPLHLERLRDAELRHVAHSKRTESPGPPLVVLVSRSQLSHQSVVQRALRLVQNLLSGSSQDDVSQLHELGVVEGGGDLSSGDQGEALHAREVSVFDRHDACLSEQLLGCQPIRVVAGDDITLTFVQVGVGEAASELLDDVNGLQVSGSLQTHHSVDGQLREVSFVMSQQFGGQRRAGDVQKILLESCRSVSGDLRCFPPAGDDGPKVLFTRSPMAMAPMKDDCRENAHRLKQTIK
ncbi:hypothetical protein F7725_022116 [Dissostichus mawsoni]|uniref:Uncharacterized protein n=1 Tax=Dissostichus mawsoni TaxID=36200 RepID=A0A7J5ZGG0_DISMA|nr:hypothetical protein F7725_022116 [Dissostichus mawsoni]